ncbi:hypothetical protein CEE37_03080 [candidate division LCP-89 bacterium B3_LCP]|uniref:Phenylacetate--CoA ligase n=1 Tax=candidate division LCP-89 bacterium B3_LCP TaxID=2012998 RepID=A0A532V2Y4_UNCL8|nr:MAG: hypothetical protein CEE37_03080 [candidate division LCP-89 bacterium B3_LCP]
MRWWNTYKILHDMKEKLHWSAAEIRRYQFWKLRQIVRFAYHNSPFYREFYDKAGFSPDQVVSFEDITKIPLLQKKQIQETDPSHVVTQRDENGEPADLDWMVENTSGSTGRPLTIKRTWGDLYHIKAKIIRAFSQTGFRFYHRQAVIKSSAESLTGKHWFERLGILRKYWMAVTVSPEFNLESLRRIRPQHIHAYPSGVLAIAELLIERGQTLDIPVICTGAEVLDHISREKLQEAFNAEIFDLYGTREVGNISWECPAHNGMHVNEDALILELLDESGAPVPDGEEGQVVVTYLDGMDFPFIRYNIGDRAIRMPGICSCGIEFSRLKQVTGRSDSRIRLPSGKWISGLVFQELRDTTWLNAFRIVQDDEKAIKLQIAVRSKPQKRQLDALVKKTRKLVQDELDVIPEIVDKLEYDNSGKIKAVVCNLTSDDAPLSK